MLKNKKLKIGIFTPSTPIGFYFPKRVERAKKFLESKGHQVLLGSLYNKINTYTSGTIEEKVQEINDLLDKDIDILMANIGGYVSTSLLPYLDYKKIEEKKVTVCGFSDITVILNAVLQKTKNTRVLYGPNFAKNFGNFEEEINEFTYQSFINQINKNGEIEIKKPDFWNEELINWEEFSRDRQMISNEWKVINHENHDFIEGIVNGGNTQSLNVVLDTEYGPTFNKDSILLIEDTSVDASILERIFANLKIRKVFDNVKAIILGKLENFNDQKTNIKPVDILLKILKDKKIPIIYDVDVSHTYPMTIIELNKSLKIDFINKKIYQ